MHVASSNALNPAATICTLLEMSDTALKMFGHQKNRAKFKKYFFCHVKMSK